MRDAGSIQVGKNSGAIKMMRAVNSDAHHRWELAKYLLPDGKFWKRFPCPDETTKSSQMPFLCRQNSWSDNVAAVAVDDEVG